MGSTLCVIFGKLMVAGMIGFIIWVLRYTERNEK